MAGLGGLALASKVAKAGGLVFNDGSTQAAGSLEGTSIKSTSETGGTKFLREDGDGTSSWQAAAGGWVELQSVTASASATVDLETGIGSTYDEYMITVSNMRPDTDDVAIQCFMKVDGSYQTTSYYRHLMYTASSSASYNGGASEAATQAIQLASQGADAGETTVGQLFFTSPDSTTAKKKIYFDFTVDYNSGSTANCTGFAKYNGGREALSGIRFQYGSGNIESGIFTLYGLTKA